MMPTMRRLAKKRRIEVARQAAEKALFEQIVIKASPKAYADFLTKLDAPSSLNECLCKMMQISAPWDKARL